MIENRNQRSDLDLDSPNRRHWAIRLRFPSVKSAMVALFAGSSIAVIGLMTRLLIPSGAPAVIASMGAAAVIVFQFPESPAARPWSVLGGHMTSAIIGVLVSHLVDDRTAAAGLAVGLSLGAMQICRCMHPPGGGTAMVAVLGGAAVQHAGFTFVIVPTLVNAVILTGLASVFRWMLSKASLDNEGS